MSSVRKIQLPDNTTVNINDERIHIYRSLTGTAAVTESPYTHAKWDVSDSTITQYVDGMVVCIKVPVAGHGTYGTALQINSLGYKPVVYNVSSMVSTRYGVGSVVWAVYNSTQTASLYINSDSATTVTGCWQVNDYGTSDTNSIGYQLRTNSSVRPTVSRTRYYRILFSSADNTQWVPANTKYDNSSTSVKPVNTTPINPFGRIVYMSGTTNVTAGSNVGAAVTWDQYAFTLGYSFNTTGSALTLTYPAPVYVKCEPQANGSAIIDSTTPYVQALPSTADGKIYIYLGQAYSETQVEMTYDHPIYYHDGTQIRQYSGDKTGDTLPSQSGNSGKFLTTDGTSASWATVSAGSSTLSALTDTTITTPSDGQVLTYDNATSKWVNSAVPNELPSQTGNSGKFLSTDGTDASWEELPVFDCILTYTEENGTTTASCNKTIGEIAAAFSDKKLVVLRPAGSLRDDGSTPENSKTPYICTYASDYLAIFVSSDLSMVDILQFSNLLPSDSPVERGVIGRNVILYSYDNYDTLQIQDGWHYKASYLARNRLTIQKNGTTIDAFNVGDADDKTINIPVPSSATDLSDITISSPTNGQILKYNSTTLKWENASETTELPSITGNANKILAVNNGATGVEWVTKPSSGLTNYDFTHTANTTISGSTTTVTFTANTRGSAMLTISADLGLTIACNNGSDNYIWVKNTGSSDVDITISGVTKNSTNVSNVYVPSDGISVPAGGLCEIGVIVNTDGAFITSRNDLAL